jgi:hypothetical protein
MELVIILSTKLFCLMFVFWRAGGANACSLALNTSRPGAALPPATVFAIGYENPSSFIAAFRIAFGCTPGRYFD